MKPASRVHSPVANARRRRKAADGAPSSAPSAGPLSSKAPTSTAVAAHPHHHHLSRHRDAVYVAGPTRRDKAAPASSHLNVSSSTAYYRAAVTTSAPRPLSPYGRLPPPSTGLGPSPGSPSAAKRPARQLQPLTAPRTTDGLTRNAASGGPTAPGFQGTFRRAAPPPPRKAGAEQSLLAKASNSFVANILGTCSRNTRIDLDRCPTQRGPQGVVKSFASPQLSPSIHRKPPVAAQQPPPSPSQSIQMTKPTTDLTRQQEASQLMSAQQKPARSTPLLNSLNAVPSGSSAASGLTRQPSRSDDAKAPGDSQSSPSNLAMKSAEPATPSGVAEKSRESPVSKKCRFPPRPPTSAATKGTAGKPDFPCPPPFILPPQHPNQIILLGSQASKYGNSSPTAHAQHTHATAAHQDNAHSGSRRRPREGYTSVQNSQPGSPGRPLTQAVPPPKVSDSVRGSVDPPRGGGGSQAFQASLPSSLPERQSATSPLVPAPDGAKQEAVHEAHNSLLHPRGTLKSNAVLAASTEKASTASRRLGRSVAPKKDKSTTAPARVTQSVPRRHEGVSLLADTSGSVGVSPPRLPAQRSRAPQMATHFEVPAERLSRDERPLKHPKTGHGGETKHSGAAAPSAGRADNRAGESSKGSKAGVPPLVIRGIDSPGESTGTPAMNSPDLRDAIALHMAQQEFARRAARKAANLSAARSNERREKEISELETRNPTRTGKKIAAEDKSAHQAVAQHDHSYKTTSNVNSSHWAELGDTIAAASGRGRASTAGRISPSRAPLSVSEAGRGAAGPVSSNQAQKSVTSVVPATHSRKEARNLSAAGAVGSAGSPPGARSLRVADNAADSNAAAPSPSIAPHEHHHTRRGLIAARMATVAKALANTDNLPHSVESHHLDHQQPCAPTLSRLSPVPSPGEQQTPQRLPTASQQLQASRTRQTFAPPHAANEQPPTLSSTFAASPPATHSTPSSSPAAPKHPEQPPAIRVLPPSGSVAEFTSPPPCPPDEPNVSQSRWPPRPCQGANSLAFRTAAESIAPGGTANRPAEPSDNNEMRIPTLNEGTPCGTSNIIRPAPMSSVPLRTAFMSGNKSGRLTTDFQPVRFSMPKEERQASPLSRSTAVSSNSAVTSANKAAILRQRTSPHFSTNLELGPTGHEGPSAVLRSPVAKGLLCPSNSSFILPRVDGAPSPPAQHRIAMETQPPQSILSSTHNSFASSTRGREITTPPFHPTPSATVVPPIPLEHRPPVESSRLVGTPNHETLQLATSSAGAPHSPASGLKQSHLAAAVAAPAPPTAPPFSAATPQRKPLHTSSPSSAIKTPAAASGMAFRPPAAVPTNHIASTNRNAFPHAPLPSPQPPSIVSTSSRPPAKVSDPPSSTQPTAELSFALQANTFAHSAPPAAATPSLPPPPSVTPHFAAHRNAAAVSQSDIAALVRRQTTAPGSLAYKPMATAAQREHAAPSRATPPCLGGALGADLHCQLGPLTGGPANGIVQPPVVEGLGRWLTAAPLRRGPLVRGPLPHRLNFGTRAVGGGGQRASAAVPHFAPTTTADFVNPNNKQSEQQPLVNPQAEIREGDASGGSIKPILSDSAENLESSCGEANDSGSSNLSESSGSEEEPVKSSALNLGQWQLQPVDEQAEISSAFVRQDEREAEKGLSEVEFLKKVSRRATHALRLTVRQKSPPQGPTEVVSEALAMQQFKRRCSLPLKDSETTFAITGNLVKNGNTAVTRRETSEWSRSTETAWGQEPTTGDSDSSAQRAHLSIGSAEGQGGNIRAPLFAGFVGVALIDIGQPAHKLEGCITLPGSKRAICIQLPEEEIIPWSSLRLDESPINRGTFGSVFRGTMNDTTEVAVKWFHCNDKCDVAEEQQRNLVRDINAYRLLKHDHIVRYLGTCVEGHLALVTEYLSGGCVYDLLYEHRDNSVISPSLRLRMARQLVEAVLYMHSLTPARAVHRDLKTANIVMAGDGNIKICDFGKTCFLTDTHMTLDDNGGAPRYMAPECFHVGSRINEKADIWALACCLIEIFGGPIPFEECFENLLVMNLVIEDKKIPAVPSWFYPPLTSVLLQCFDWETTKRPSAEDIAEVLETMTESDAMIPEFDDSSYTSPQILSESVSPMPEEVGTEE